MPELTIFSIISTLLLFGFIIWGVMRFGLLGSYSHYARKWGEAVPLNSTNIWTIVTLVAAFLLAPAMIELGTASLWQFLGFLVPVYLIIVSLTPEWETKRTQYIVHCIGALVCAIGAFFWLTVIMDALFVFTLVLVFVATLALLTGTEKTSAIFWAEMVMFISVYLVVLLSLFIL